ncbi:MAG: DbpA RNA binding domain-containing protein [Spirochaetia bacterium]|nr:DbpA RNA binding domain-containing protein [Spirochaetia bacterium]
MDEKTRLIEEISKKAAETADLIKNCNDPELLVRAAKAVRKQIPYRYRRYAAAWFLLSSCAKPAAGNSRSQNNGKPKAASKPQTVTEGFVNLFVNAGKRNKVNASDLSRHFGKTLDIPLTKIATVRVFPAYSFIEIDADDAERAVKTVTGTSLNGKKITVSYSTRK